MEDGTTDPAVDWVTPFEAETGCKVTVQTFGTSDEAFTLFQTNPAQYDVMSASGDASLRLVAGGFVQPVNMELIPSYARSSRTSRTRPTTRSTASHYGVPHGRGANLLMWRTDEVTRRRRPGARVRTGVEFAGKVTVYDAPIYIADAAVLLMKTKPELGITNPYALDDTQFAAAIDLLESRSQPSASTGATTPSRSARSRTATP